MRASLGGEPVDLLSLPDLVRSKKTQRDKDWPMITRLLEASYFGNRDEPSREHIDFWLRELRTPSLLIEVAGRFPAECVHAASRRPLLVHAEAGRAEALTAALDEEEAAERAADATYWAPLRQELAALRRER